MTDPLLTALDNCLTALAHGASVESCLARYPDLADDLRPLLQAAQHAQSLPLSPPSRAAQQASRARFLTRAGDLRPAPRRLWPTVSLLRLAGAFIAVLALFLSARGISAASAIALPGDLLYPVKRALEQAELWLAADPAAVQAVHIARRAAEVQTVIQQGRIVPVEFEGALTALIADTWTVGGFRVQVLPATPILNGPPVIGVWVRVHAQLLANGSLRANRLTLLTPPFTATPRPSPAFTRTPEPRDTERPTRTPEPRNTDRPTRTPEPRDTDRPTRTPKPDDDHS